MAWFVRVQRAILEALFPIYLKRLRIDLDPTREEFNSGLAWATEPFVSQAALLRGGGFGDQDRSWTAFEYVVAADDGQGGRVARSVPHELWPVILKMAQPHEGLVIGMAAHLRGERAVEMAAFRLAAGSGHPDCAPAGAYNVGILLQEDGDVDGAKVAYQMAIDSGHRFTAPAAAADLGALLMQVGEVRAARDALEFAITSDSPDERSRAAVLLNQLLAGDDGDDDVRSGPSRNR